MIKKLFVFFVLQIMIITFCSGCALLSNPLSGEIIFADNSNISGGVVSYDLKLKKESKLLKKGLYSGAEFNNECTKILLTAFDSKLQAGKYNFFEYDVSNGTLTPIGKKSKKVSDVISNVRYIPNSESISYIRDDFMYIYNPDTRTEKEIVSADRFTWSKDGSHFLYNQGIGVIDIYDMKTKKSKFLFNGSDPEYSKDNKYVAYISVGENLFCVKELKTGKVWTYNSKDSVWNYRFSPDGKYIGIVKHSNRSLFQYSSTLIAWNYKNNVDINIYSDFPGSDNFGWKKQ